MLTKCGAFKPYENILYVFQNIIFIQHNNLPCIAFFNSVYEYISYICVLALLCMPAWPRGNKTFFMLNLTEHEISLGHKMKIPTFKTFIFHSQFS